MDVDVIKLKQDVADTIDRHFKPTKPKPDIIGWYEANAPWNWAMRRWRTDVQPEYLDRPIFAHFSYGVDTLEGAGASAVILTVPSNLVENWFSDLPISLNTNLRVIGGIQTLEWYAGDRVNLEQADAFRKFCDKEATQQIIDAAKFIVEQTGHNTVVLENEAALRPFNTGDISSAFHQELVPSLQLLAAEDIEWWFNFPRILSDVVNFMDPGRVEWTKRLVGLIARFVPKAKFLDPSPCLGYSDLRGILVQEVGAGRVIDRTFIRATDQWVNGVHYQDPAWLLEKRAGETTIVYPGCSDWIPTCQALKEEVTS